MVEEIEEEEEDMTIKMEMIEEVEVEVDTGTEETVKIEIEKEEVQEETEVMIAEEEETMVVMAIVAAVLVDGVVVVDLVGILMVTTKNLISTTNTENHQNELHHMVVRPTEDQLLILRISIQHPLLLTTKEIIEQLHLVTMILEIERCKITNLLHLLMVQ